MIYEEAVAIFYKRCVLEFVKVSKECFDKNGHWEKGTCENYDEDTGNLISTKPCYHFPQVNCFRSCDILPYVNTKCFNWFFPAIIFETRFSPFPSLILKKFLWSPVPYWKIMIILMEASFPL
jgi:hypothetical protein